MKLSLIIPCYNEEDCVEAFFEAANAVFSAQTYETEYIFVNDGSEDNTLSLLKKIYIENEHVNLISFSRNFGKEAAMYAGLKQAKGDYICFIDADLQQRPELAAKMVDLLEKHREYDCIAAFAKERKDDTKWAHFFKKSFYKIITSVSGIEFVDGASDFRCFRHNMANAVLELSEYHRFTKGLFSWVGFHTRYVPYEIRERSGGESKWSIGKLFSYAIDGIIAFSNKPLRLPLYIGIGSVAFGILYLFFYLIFNLVRSQALSEAAILICLLFIFFGITLAAIGVLGEYIGKIHVQVKNRPIYIERESYQAKDRRLNAPVLQQQLDDEAAQLKKLKIKRAKFKELKRQRKIMEELVAQQQLEQEAQDAEQQAEEAVPEEAPAEEPSKKVKAKKQKNKKVKLKKQNKSDEEDDDVYAAGPESGFEDE